MHCLTSDLWKTDAKNSVTNVNSLTQLYPILRNLNSTICYHSSKHSLETSVILSLGKCARHIYSIQVQSVEQAHSVMEKWHPQQSTNPWEVFSADLFAIFKAIYWGNCTWFNLSRLTAPFIWFRELELDYGYLMNYCLSRRISEREIVGVWKPAMLVTADWSTGEFRRWREMLESDVKTSLD